MNKCVVGFLGVVVSFGSVVPRSAGFLLRPRSSCLTVSNIICWVDDRLVASILLPLYAAFTESLCLALALCPDLSTESSPCLLKVKE